MDIREVIINRIVKLHREACVVPPCTRLEDMPREDQKRAKFKRYKNNGQLEDSYIYKCNGS